jgi:hypothetical protein
LGEESTTSQGFSNTVLREKRTQKKWSHHHKEAILSSIDVIEINGRLREYRPCSKILVKLTAIFKGIFFTP